MSCVLIEFEEGEKERGDLAVRCRMRQKVYSIEQGGERPVTNGCSLVTDHPCLGKQAIFSVVEK